MDELSTTSFDDLRLPFCCNMHGTSDGLFKYIATIDRTVAACQQKLPELDVFKLASVFSHPSPNRVACRNWGVGELRGCFRCGSPYHHKRDCNVGVYTHACHGGLAGPGPLTPTPPTPPSVGPKVPDHWRRRRRREKFYCLWQVDLAENLPQATHTLNGVKTIYIQAKICFT